MSRNTVWKKNHIFAGVQLIFWESFLNNEFILQAMILCIKRHTFIVRYTHLSMVIRL